MSLRKRVAGETFAVLVRILSSAYVFRAEAAVCLVLLLRGVWV